ncbi:hypothetical protein BDN67DRAFT_971988 [Paxillus ammoniavirescens]|nr:hypothetical protein BDN67DRAFT_971988 [Paxillus ammoniavirescens]
MQSLFARPTRQCSLNYLHIRVRLIPTRRLSSLLTLAPLEKRTHGFAKFAYKVTKDPIWTLISLLRRPGGDELVILEALGRCGISQIDWMRWKSVVDSPSLEYALEVLRQNQAAFAEEGSISGDLVVPKILKGAMTPAPILTEAYMPSWVIIALVSHKIRSPDDAQSAVHNLIVPLTSLTSSPTTPTINPHYAPPLLILTIHSLAHFALVSLLRPLTSHFLSLPPHTLKFKSFHFNMLLQAISLFPKSDEAAGVAVKVLTEMGERGARVWADTERVLIRERFVTMELAECLRSRDRRPHAWAEERKKERLEAWLKAYARLGQVEESAKYLDAIRDHCLENGVTPPYSGRGTDGDSGTFARKDEQHRILAGHREVHGIPHQANTLFLRSMQNDRTSAFRYLHHLLKLERVKAPQSSIRLPLSSHSASSHPTPKMSRPRFILHRPPTKKSSIDIYDWTTTLYSASHDRLLSTASLLKLFRTAKEGTKAFKPTVATYTVVMSGLVWRGALSEAVEVWDEFIREVVGGQEERDGEKKAFTMKIDRKALCVGVMVLVRSGRAVEGIYLLDEFVKMEMENTPTSSNPLAVETTFSSSSTPSTPSYLTPHPIHTLLTSLLRIRRPDVIFYIWTHLTSLYFLLPTDTILHILLKAAVLASKMDGESVRGAMAWYLAENRLFRRNTGTSGSGTVAIENRDSTPNPNPETTTQDGAGTSASTRTALSAHLLSLLQNPAPPPITGIWDNRRSTEVARSIFRGMIFGNWPALRGTSTLKGVASGRATGGEGVWGELTRGFSAPPAPFLPPGASIKTGQGVHNPQHTHTYADPHLQNLGAAIPSIHPSERTFSAYISLLGLSSHAHEIPEALRWMKALGVAPTKKTLSVALVFWAEVGLRGPLFEEGWVGRGVGMGWRQRNSGTRDVYEGNTTSSMTPPAPPTTEYTALQAWIRAWVGEERCPTEADIQKGVWAVAKMRDRGFGKRGGHVVACETVGRKWKRWGGWGQRMYGQ